jgi:RecB family endonuclease NucS
VRLVIARCGVDYVGRLTAYLPSALRLLIVEADGSVLGTATAARTSQIAKPRQV